MTFVKFNTLLISAGHHSLFLAFVKLFAKSSFHLLSPAHYLFTSLWKIALFQKKTTQKYIFLILHKCFMWLLSYWLFQFNRLIFFSLQLVTPIIQVPSHSIYSSELFLCGHIIFSLPLFLSSCPSHMCIIHMHTHTTKPTHTYI